MKFSFKKVFKKKTGSIPAHIRKPDERHPQRDWGIILLLFVVFLSGGAYFSYSTFFTYVGDGREKPDTFQKSQKIDREVLESVVQVIEIRGNTYTIHSTNPQIIVDPSQ